jgi:hypothetical protein
MSTAFVRLKPHNPKIGNVRERYRMGAACGWGDLMFVAGELHELDHAAGVWLRDNVLQRDHDPASAKAFDVWFSRAECAAALRQEKLARLGRARRPFANPDAGKPPKLEAARRSDLDEPAGSTDLEAELAEEMEAEASGDLGAHAVTRDAEGNLLEAPDADYGDIAPTDDDALIAAAMGGDTPDPAAEVASRPPPPKRRAPKKAAKKTAKKPPKRKPKA